MFKKSICAVALCIQIFSAHGVGYITRDDLRVLTVGVGFAGAATVVRSYLSQACQESFCNPDCVVPAVVGCAITSIAFYRLATFGTPKKKKKKRVSFEFPDEQKNE